ncbi:cytochrome c biogenesis protein ResB [Caryophanon latum]|uniref:Cytochrome C biogenesis protein n=1 Tax=Caryophanon latum TaxID=33977 RepID=A0A1C0YZ32_9BACL|nr:cytochrome c biogenesis protein ResB [Caryophanon latum]OCS92430.1 cytochrome C biogenesis protein [Caryophanon latum]
MKMNMCECGQQNPYGTHLCIQCGRPLTDEEKEKKVADMRYEGSAVRSKTYNASWIDKVWNFFSSVKVGVALIVITLVAAAIGTFLPQAFFIPATEENAGAYYENVYGTFGKIYYALGLTDLYTTWWFQVIVGLLGVSIIVASLDRGIPLHKSLTNQRVKRHTSFLKRQRLFAQGSNDVDLQQAANTLKQMKYNVRTEDGAVFAEKNRFARYGAYVNHVGLIIFLAGVMLRVIPGMYVDDSMWAREGQITAVPGMDGYFLENKEFILELHDEQEQTAAMAEQGVNTVAKNFQTNVVLYKQPEGALPGNTSNLEVVQEYAIRVNHPLKEAGYAFYQMDYRLNDELKTMTFALTNKETQQSLGEVTIDLYNPETSYVIDEQTRIDIIGYYPHFTGFEEGEPQTGSRFPTNPAFLFKMFTPQTPEGETSFVGIQQTVEPLGDNAYQMRFVSTEFTDISGLTIRLDRTIPILFVGAIIFLIGVAMGSYWQHRRIWLLVQDDTLYVAAHTNKNWFSMQKDMKRLEEAVQLPHVVDQLDEEPQQQKGDDAQ